MESDCRIPVACCRPRVLVLHALFWGLVSLRLVSLCFLEEAPEQTRASCLCVPLGFRVFGAALLGEEKPTGENWQPFSKILHLTVKRIVDPCLSHSSESCCCPLLAAGGVCSDHRVFSV